MTRSAVGGLARRIRGAALCAGVLLPAAGHAARVEAPANPVDRVITIQPYQVCDSAGVACAPVTFLPQYLTVANVILNQAGIALAAAPVVRINDSAYLNPTTTNTNFDNLRDLVRLPANAPATTSPDTLNVWFVNTLRNVAVPATPRFFYGFGLIGGNGAVVATGLDPARRTAAADTLAHEIAHNLGLPHPEDPPARSGSQGGLPYNAPGNLMRSVGRAVVDATNICAVPPYTCATGTAAANARGALVPDQVAALRAPPIFRELPNLRTSVQDRRIFDGGSPVAGGLRFSISSTVQADFVADSPSGLRALSYRFKNASVVTGLAVEVVNVFPDPGEPDGPFPAVTGTARATVAGGNATVDVTLSAPVHSPLDVLTTFQIVGVRPEGSCCDITLPFSSQYSFVNGVTSRFGFSGTGVGENAVEFGFDPAVPHAPPVTLVLPRDVGEYSPITGQPVGALFEPNWTTPEALARIPLPFDAFEPNRFAAVPAPPGWGVVALGALALLGLRRRARA